MKFDFPFKKKKKKKDRVSTELTQFFFFSRIRMKYMHIAFHQIQKENKWRQQFLAELSVLHHYIKGMTINTYIMKSNIQNFQDKYIIYSWYVTKISLSERKCVLEQKYDNELRYSYILNGFEFCSFFFSFFFLNFFVVVDLKEHGKDRCINI